jgi:hypothetical protein
VHCQHPEDEDIIVATDYPITREEAQAVIEEVHSGKLRPGGPEVKFMGYTWKMEQQEE